MEISDKVYTFKSVSNPSPRITMEAGTNLSNGEDSSNLLNVLSLAEAGASENVHNEIVGPVHSFVRASVAANTENLQVPESGLFKSIDDPEDDFASDFQNQLNTFEETIKTSAKMRSDAFQSFSAFVTKQQELEEYFSRLKNEAVERLKPERMKKEAEFVSMMSNINLCKMQINEELTKTQEKLAASELALRRQTEEFSQCQKVTESLKRRLCGMKDENASLKTIIKETKCKLATSERAVSDVRAQSELVKKEFEAEINGLNQVIKFALEELKEIVTSKDKERREKSENFAEFKQLCQTLEEKDEGNKKQNELVTKYVAQVQQLQQMKVENEKLKRVSEAKMDHLLSFCIPNESRIEQLQRSLSMKEENIAECQHEIAQLNSTIVQLQEQLTEMSNDNRRLRSLCNKTNDGKFPSKAQELEIKRLNLSLANKRKRVEKLQEYLSEKRQVVISCEKTLAEDKDCIAALKSDITKKVQEIAHLKDQLVSIEQQANEFKQKFVEQNGSKEELKKQFENDLLQSHKKIADFQNVIVAKDVEISNFDKRLSEQSMKIEELNKTIAENESNSKEQHDTIVYLYLKVGDLERQKATCCEENLKLHAKLEVTKSQEEEIGTEKQNVASLQKKFSEQSMKIEELNKIIAENESNLKEQNDTIVRLYLKVDQLEARKATCPEQKLKLNAKLELTKTDGRTNGRGRRMGQRRTKDEEIGTEKQKVASLQESSSSQVLSSGGAAYEQLPKNYVHCKTESLTMSETKNSNVVVSWEMKIKDKNKRIRALNNDLHNAKWEIANLKSWLDKVPDNGSEKDTYHQCSYSDRKRKRYYH